MNIKLSRAKLEDLVSDLIENTVLDHQPAAVDIGGLFKFEKDFLGAGFLCTVVSAVEKRFGEGGYVTANVQQYDVAMGFDLYFIRALVHNVSSFLDLKGGGQSKSGSQDWSP